MTIILDIEADSQIAEEANLKFLGVKDIRTGEYCSLDYTQTEEIHKTIHKHKIIIGFNIKSYDVTVLKNFGVDFQGKIIVDLWEALAPKGDRGFGKFNKNRLHDINPSLKPDNYKLKTLIEILKLDEIGKGEIDYKIFQKDDWDDKERKEIDKYLKQDVELTEKLFNWYKDVFTPLEKYLDKSTVARYKHLTCTSGSLAYKIICNRLNIDEEYEEENDKPKPRISGGHHIHPRWEKVRGKIICRDFVSHYPTIMIMANLFSKCDKPSDKEKVLEELLSTRIEAKKKGDKKTALALKVPLNSIYGITGRPSYKNLYDPHTANECTRIGRELLKKLAKTLDVAGFVPIYGFTDSVYTGIPKGLTEEDLDFICKYFIEQEKKKFPNPIKSFDLGVDNIIKFIWFIGKKDNNYLWVDKDNRVGIKGGLLDKNTPQVIIDLFEDYIKPKIVKELDVNFTTEELITELLRKLEKNPELSAQDFSVKDPSSYSSKTSLQYQISKKYGGGIHKMIPIKKEGVGVGKVSKYCDMKDFKKNKLGLGDISTERMIRYIQPFWETKEEVFDLNEEVKTQ